MKTLPSSVVELTQALVQIPSVNPDGETGTAHTGELACAQFVASFLQACGAEVVLEEVLPGRPNVIGRFPSKPSSTGAPKQRILFGPHTDTVGVGGMTIPPFGGEIREGRLWGRGACDTKGPMASMLWTLWELREEIADLSVEVHFVGFMSEETAQFGSRHFAKHHGADYAFAIIGEPTSMQTVFKHKGCLWVDVETYGLAVHASRPELGENAIVKMARLIKALDGDFRRQLAEAGGEDPWLGKSTISMGMIQGGTRPNIAADYCRLTVDIRYTPLIAKQGGPLTMLQQFVKAVDPQATLSPANTGARRNSGALAGEEALLVQPCLDTSADDPFVKVLVACGAPLTGAPWFCDAAFLADVGLPAVAIGPGNIAQAHTKDEFIETQLLEEAVVFWKRFLRGL